jgi:Ca-activated chloride channel homolog
MKKILIATLLLFVAQLGFASAGSNSTNSASVTGTVVDATTKKPLADVTVVAVNGSNKSETVTTNAQGHFKIATLAQGTYTLKLTKEDYKNSEKKEVVIKPENTVKVTVEMVAETLESNSHRSWWDKYDLYL